jgi:hypothetical protein
MRPAVPKSEAKPNLAAPEAKYSICKDLNRVGRSGRKGRDPNFNRKTPAAATAERWLKHSARGECVKKEPEAPRQGDFRFLGCDLVDRECFISALTSCGGFPDVFGNSELSPPILVPMRGSLTAAEMPRQRKERSCGRLPQSRQVTNTGLSGMSIALPDPSAHTTGCAFSLVVCRAFPASQTNRGTKVPRGLKSALR